MVVWTRADGSRLRLGDVATVVDGFAETDQLARFDGTPTMMVSVFRTGNQSAIEIAALMHAYIDDANTRLPDGLSLTIWQDSAQELTAQLSLMLRTGATGFVLVFIALALFLDLRLALWVSLGIPISFLGAVALMPTLDVSINMMSLFAFVLVLGIVVDDAIIVGENIFRHQEDHGDGLRGSIEGAQEISKPVIFAVLTTVAAFTPLLFVPGMMGKMFRLIPLIVIPCLLFSLIESLGILPAHLSHMKKPGPPGAWRRFQGLFANGLKLFIRKVYRPTLEFGLSWRYLTAGSSGFQVADLDACGGFGVGQGSIPRCRTVTCTPSSSDLNHRGKSSMWISRCKTARCRCLSLFGQARRRRVRSVASAVPATTPGRDRGGTSTRCSTRPCWWRRFPASTAQRMALGR